MATFLDVSTLSLVTPIFVFLLIFVLVYAIVLKTKILGENNALMVTAALSVAVISMFAGSSVPQFIINTVPWIVALFIGLLFLIFIYLFLGGSSEKEIMEQLGLKWVVFVILIVIVFIGLVQVIRLSPLQQSQGGNLTSEDTFKQEIVSTLVHPRILGALFLMIIAAFAVKLLTDQVKK